MAFSQTVSQTVFNTRKVMDRAFGRCRLPPESISAEHIDIAKDQLYLLLSDLPNMDIPLWTIERQIYPLYEGVASVTLTDGTVDVLKANFRTLSEVTGSNTDTSTARSIAFSASTLVTSVGVKWDAASVPLLFERSDDGATWTTIQSEADPEAVQGEWTWFDMSPLIAAAYFRITATSGTLSFQEIFTGNTPNEIPLGVLNRDQYTNLPSNANLTSRPTDFWFDKRARNHLLRLWQTPNSSAEHSQVIVWRQRYIMDVGTMQQEIEVPQRWYQALVSLLAARLAYEIREVDPQLIPVLENKAAADLRLAQQGGQGEGPYTVTPNIGAYTA